MAQEGAAVSPDIAIPAWSGACDSSSTLVSVVMPVYNAARWLEECLQSVADQTFPHGRLEVSMYDDLSTDSSWDLMVEWKGRLEQSGISVVLGRNVVQEEQKRGCGHARNEAVRQSSGAFLCFLDSDDYMLPSRIQEQIALALAIGEPAIIGCNFEREPPTATPRYTEWHNSLTDEDLQLQQYKEVTIIQPTWLMARAVFTSIGGFDDSWPGTPEDMMFFYRWLQAGGIIRKVPRTLLVYRWHTDATSLGVHRKRLLLERVRHLEQMVLEGLESFSIWSVGRDGKKFFMTLQQKYRDKVECFCDVNPAKVGQIYPDVGSKRHIPIVHFSEVRPPVVIGVAVNRSLAGRPVGEFEENLQSMGWVEGRDYWHLY